VIEIRPERRPVAIGCAVIAALVLAGCGAAAPSTTVTQTAPATGGAATGASSGASASTSAAVSGSGTDLAVTTPAAKGTYTAPLTWEVYRETNSLDPIFAFDYPESTVDSALCESLLAQQADGTIGPGLATAITNPDPKTFLITLRKGVTFWDGSPLTSADVAYDLGRMRDAKLGGFYTTVMQRVTSIEATGPLEVTLKLSQPDYWLRGELSGPVGLIYSKAYAVKKGKAFGTVSGGTMCTGGLKLSSWKTGQGITAVPYDGYWNQAAKPKITSINFRGVPTDAAITAGLETGEISGAYPQQLSSLTKFRTSKEVKVYEGPSYISDSMILSNFKGALGDVRVRRALSMAIDRQGIIDTVYKGAAILPRTITNPGSWGYGRDVFQKAWDALPDPKLDLTAAKALIKAAGAEGKPITIGTSSELTSLNVEATSIQAAAEAIGLKASLHSVSAANYINFFIDAKARQGIDGFLTTNYSDYADPAGLYNTLALPGGSQNYTGYSNPAVTKAMDAARAEADDTKRAEDVVAAQKLIMQDLPWIPIVSPRVVLIMNSKITGAPASFQYMFGPWANGLGAAG
jgi:peptide/nickel transport system substrate-binding protein